MAEKVAKTGIVRDKDYMYYVKNGGVWKVRRKQPGVPKGKPEKVIDGGFEMSTDFIYFIDKAGDVSRAPRAVGGQKRKKGKKAKQASKKAVKKAPKKTAKKVAKKAVKPAKKATKKAVKKAVKKAAPKTAKKAPAKKAAKKPAKKAAAKRR